MTDSIPEQTLSNAFVDPSMRNRGLCGTQFAEPRMDDFCKLSAGHPGPHLSQNGWKFEVQR